VLKWRGLRVPRTNLVNPASARRIIRLTHYLLPLLRRRARILAKKDLRAPFDPSAYGIDTDESAIAVNG
jgi:hypothetical protein